VGPRPVPAALELPAVDDVADEVELIRFVVPQEIQQKIGLATGSTQVNIGYPDSPVSGYQGIRNIARIQVACSINIMSSIKSCGRDSNIASGEITCGKRDRID
jgi:hypothetical protein